MSILWNNNDVIEVTYVCSLDDQIGLNIRRYRVSKDGIGDLNQEYAASQMSVFCNSAFKGAIAETALYRGLGVERVFPTRTVKTWTNFGAGPGLMIEPALPSQVCGAVSLFSERPGRRGRGRAYIPFPGRAAQDVSGRPSLLYQAAAANVAQFFLGYEDLGDGNAAFDITGVTREDVGPPGLTFPWTAFVVKLGFSTQRRRGFFGAKNSFPI